MPATRKEQPAYTTARPEDFAPEPEYGYGDVARESLQGALLPASFLGGPVGVAAATALGAQGVYDAVRPGASGMDRLFGLLGATALTRPFRAARGALGAGAKAGEELGRAERLERSREAAMARRPASTGRPGVDPAAQREAATANERFWPGNTFSEGWSGQRGIVAPSLTGLVSGGAIGGAAAPEGEEVPGAMTGMALGALAPSMLLRGRGRPPMPLSRNVIASPVDEAGRALGGFTPRVYEQPNLGRRLPVKLPDMPLSQRELTELQMRRAATRVNQ